MATGYLVTNISSGEVALPSPFNRTLGIGKSTSIIVDDPAEVENNPTIKTYVNNRIIELQIVPIQVSGGTSNSQYVLIPGPVGPVGPQGPQGAPGSGVTMGTYTCPPTVALNDIVYLVGGNVVDKGDADDVSKQPVIGMVSSKPTVTTADVIYVGEVTGFGGLTTGATYYLSITPGQITATAPSAPGDVVQRVGFAKDAATFVVMVDRDYIVL